MGCFLLTSFSMTAKIIKANRRFRSIADLNSVSVIRFYCDEAFALPTADHRNSVYSFRLVYHSAGRNDVVRVNQVLLC